MNYDSDENSKSVKRSSRSNTEKTAFPKIKNEKSPRTSNKTRGIQEEEK
jgi:hypothetical protein